MAGAGCAAVEVMVANLSPGLCRRPRDAPWQPGAVRLRWFLTMTTILAATVGLTVLVSERLEAGGDAADQVIDGAAGTVGPGRTSTTTTRGGSTVPPAGHVTLTGTVTAVHLEGAVIDPREVPTPLTVVSGSGFGNGGEITGVTVQGTDKSIVWDGGRPFVLSSGGALVLDPVTVDLAPEGVRLALSDAIHAFTPGTYQLDTPVAVGSSGVAEARDAVTFATTDRSRFEPRGDAALHLPATVPHHFVGPGKVHLEGALELADASGSRGVVTVDMADGAFDITLTPVTGGGWTIVATLRGETSTT